MRQFWHESVTAESWEILQKLAKGHDFVLIGGWAAYLHTRAQKSKDIDIVVDFEELRKLDEGFPLSKNERLSKYEIKHGQVDIDIYVPKYSHLSYPIRKILEKHEIIEGIKTASACQLLLLKLGAYLDRKGTVKGEKDAIDIMALLAAGEFDSGTFRKEAGESSVEKPLETIREIVSEFPDSSLVYVGMKFIDFKRWRRAFLKTL